MKLARYSDYYKVEEEFGLNGEDLIEGEIIA